METITHPEQLEQRLARELAPFRQLGKSEDMEDYYQATDWVRENCTFTETGDLVFHGGTTEQVPVRCHYKSRNDAFLRLLETEAERNNTHLNKAVFTKVA